MVELLSPAGNFDSFRAAVENGADAIYMGLGKYNAREMANNFTLEEYINAINYAHKRGVRVFLTLNTLLRDDEFEDAISQVISLYCAGLDACIIQDMGLAMALKKVIPEIELHASTQMSVHNLRQVKFLENHGFSRVVLGRELSIKEIEYICNDTGMEVEVFVHGALCVSYSGQCLMSSMIGNRSANRGKCAQTCRMKYSLYDNDGKIIKKNKYLLSKKDIFGLEHLQELSKAGVKSFKIEGRNKNPEYVAQVTSLYRKYVDENISVASQEDKLRLMQIFNRSGLSSGYLDGVHYKDSITDLTPKNTGLKLGEVIQQKKEYIKVRLEQDIDMHDGIEIYSNDDTYSTIVTSIRDEKFNIVNGLVESGNIVWLGDIKRQVEIQSPIYKTSSAKQNEELNRTFNLNGFNRKVDLDLEIRIKKDQKIEVRIFDSLNGESHKDVFFEFEYIPETAKTKAIDEEYVKTQLSKTNDTPYIFKNIIVDLDDNLFVPMSRLNEIRKHAIEKFERLFVVNKDDKEYRQNLNDLINNQKDRLKKAEEKKNKNIKNRLFVYRYDSSKNYSSDYSGIYFNIADVYNHEKEIFERYLNKVKVFVYIPNIVNEKMDKIIVDNLKKYVNKGISGVLIGNIGYIDFVNEIIKTYKDIEIISDYSFNVTNTYSAEAYKDAGIHYITPSLETEQDEIKNISKIVPLEIVRGYATVMSSRYCIVGSFVADREIGQKCSMPCKKKNYCLIDSYGLKYDLLCDSTDCIMSIVRKIGEIQKDQEVMNINSIRNCII